jgi:hypothetical protein
MIRIRVVSIRPVTAGAGNVRTGGEAWRLSSARRVPSPIRTAPLIRSSVRLRLRRSSLTSAGFRGSGRRLDARAEFSRKPGAHEMTLFLGHLDRVRRRHLCFDRSPR